ncbi:hypothetical protein B0H10DRAFT_1942544 [Mycena sp. CBHHK59/15]|nr:hypothetical protein B0H10DRAFT_1942544 [Mycena sp. CBHHK59/15]
MSSQCDNATYYDSEADYLRPSSRSGSDYEALPSQKQEIQCVRERRRDDAIKAEDRLSSPIRAPRPSAAMSSTTTRGFYEPGGALDSQTTSQQFLDNILPAEGSRTHVFNKRVQRPDYDTLLARCLKAEDERDQALVQLAEANNALQKAHKKVTSSSNALKNALRLLGEAEEELDIVEVVTN